MGSGVADVAVLVPDLSGGGAERVAVLLANAFARRGLITHLVCGVLRGSFQQDVMPDVCLVGLSRRRFRWVLPRLVSYLRRERPAVLLSLLTQANGVAILARRLALWRGRLVVSERSNLSSATQTAQVWWVRLLPWLVRRLYPSADHVVAVSEGVRSYLTQEIGLQSDLVSVIGNPIPVSAIRRSAVTEPNHPWFSSPGAPIVVAIGRLHAEKDLATLISAVALLRERREVRLVVFGEGPERRALEGLIARLGIEDHVSLPGFTRNVHACLARAQVLALSSRSEGFPNVLLEALALGVPVVSTDCASGPAEVLDGGRFGRLVPVGDAPALADAIEVTLETPPDPTGLRQRAEVWDVEYVVDRYLDVLLEREGLAG